jgi:hydrogenase maturation factor
MAACQTPYVHALHDPTEGGLATALLELAQSAGLQATLRPDDVPVLPETKTVCTALGLDPLGLLASGALLIAVDPAGCDAVRNAVEEEKIAASCIGELASGKEDVIMNAQSRTPVPRFERDELARFLEALGEERPKAEQRD